MILRFYISEKRLKIINIALKKDRLRKPTFAMAMFPKLVEMFKEVRLVSYQVGVALIIPSVRSSNTVYY